MIEENTGFPGALPSPLDERDYKWEEIAMGLSTIDWRKGYDVEKKLGVTIAAKDQGPSFSCGGQAWAYLAAVQEALATGTYEERSAKFVYAQTAVRGGGSAGRTNSILYKDQGVCLEPLCVSYKDGKAPDEAFMVRSADITSQARTDARKALAKSYVSVSPDINSIAQAISANGGVIIGIAGTDNGTWRSEFPKAPVDGESQWNHWVYAGKAKMIRGKRHIGIINSWGLKTGDKGWQWISEDYIHATAYNPSFGFERACVWEVWSVSYNTDVPNGYTHNFAKDIAYGERGDEVRALQLSLQEDGSFPAGFNLSQAAYPVAYYGDMTAAAVVKFRIKHGVDGSSDPRGRSAGPRTRAALNEIFNK